MKTKLGKPGFALISVLALVSVLIMLLGALMGTNRTTFGLLRHSQAKDRIDRTVSSVYSYCRFRIEHDSKWGKQPFAARSPIYWGHLKVTEIAGPPGDIQTVVGHDDANGTSFAVEICNNLKSNGEVALLKDLDPEDERSGVPVGFCRLTIKVEGDGHLEGAEVMVRNPGLVGAVCLASEALKIDSKNLDMLTKDPIKNQARSLGKTKLTGIRNFLEGRSTTGSASAEVSLDNPVIWSGDDNLFSLDDGATFKARQPFKDSHPGLDFQDERFVDAAKSLFETPDVELYQLEEVKAADGGPKDVREITPGQYRFEQFGDPPVRVLTRRAAAAPQLENRSATIEQFWWKSDDPNASMTTASVAATIGANPSVGDEQVGTGYLNINEDGGARVDLLRRRIVLDTDYNFKVNGDFSLYGDAPTTEDNPSGDRRLRQVNPALHFADRIKAGADFSEAANAANASKEKGSLKADGCIYIQGDISGSAVLAAKDDVTIKPGRFYDPNGNSELERLGSDSKCGAMTFSEAL